MRKFKAVLIVSIFLANATIEAYGIQQANSSPDESEITEQKISVLSMQPTDIIVDAAERATVWLNGRATLVRIDSACKSTTLTGGRHRWLRSHPGSVASNGEHNLRLLHDIALEPDGSYLVLDDNNSSPLHHITEQGVINEISLPLNVRQTLRAARQRELKDWRTEGTRTTTARTAEENDLGDDRAPPDVNTLMLDAMTIDRTGSIYIIYGTQLFHFSPGSPRAEVRNLLEGAGAKSFYAYKLLAAKSGSVYLLCESKGTLQIRKIAADGKVSILFSEPVSGNSLPFNRQKMAIDGQDNLYLVNDEDQKIIRIDANGKATSFVGGGAGINDGHGSEARFFSIKSIFMDPHENLWILDGTMIRRATASEDVTTICWISG